MVFKININIMQVENEYLANGRLILISCKWKMNILQMVFTINIMQMENEYLAHGIQD